MSLQKASKLPQSKGLKPLKLWMALLYPLIFGLVGLYTWMLDKFASLVPNRRFESYSFLPTLFASWNLNEPLQVLVVDGNACHREISHHLLEKNGTIADFACDGMEAIRACRQKHYDLVLLDIYLLGISGLEATAAIRRESTRDIRIIAITGVLPVDEVHMLAAGVDGYLKTPLVSSELQKEVRVSSALRYRAR
ncbi:MAG: response regulator [Chitinophagaceae bacterium]|nr:response regulator [Oligoflexus sp.]